MSADDWATYSVSAVRRRVLADQEAEGRAASTLADDLIRKKLDGVTVLGRFTLEATPEGMLPTSRQCGYYREAAMERLRQLGMVDVGLVDEPGWWMNEKVTSKKISFTIPEVADE